MQTQIILPGKLFFTQKAFSFFIVLKVRKLKIADLKEEDMTMV